jgi:hypothetical protein
MDTAVSYNAILKLPSGRLLGSYRMFPVLGVVRIWAVEGEITLIDVDIAAAPHSEKAIRTAAR